MSFKFEKINSICGGIFRPYDYYADMQERILHQPADVECLGFHLKLIPIR